MTAVERVLGAIEPTNTVVDRHPQGEEIKALLVDWSLQPESSKTTFTSLVQDIVDRYAQDGSLGKDPHGALQYYLREHVADKLVLSRAFMNKAFLDGRRNRNLLEQEYDTLAMVDRAIQKAQARVEASEEGEGMGNLMELIDRRQAVLRSIRDLEMILGNLQDQRVTKSVSLHHHEHVADSDAKSIMQRMRKKARVIDATPVDTERRD